MAASAAPQAEAQYSLADALAVALPALPPALADAETRARLLALANRLPPIALGGFEVRLAAREPQVDLMQGITVNRHEPALLAAHIPAAVQAAGLTGAPAAAWERVRAFAERWADPAGALRHAIPEIWLEFDVHATAGALPIPSVFIKLEPTNPEALHQAQAALDTLAGAPLPAPVAQCLARCAQACRRPAMVSHVGVMLSRSAEALRINVAGMAASDIVSYLDRADWPGPHDELDALLPQLAKRAERITVCLDAGGALYPHLGLECALLSQPPAETRWAALLGLAVERGWCATDKRQALLDWAGQTNPTDSPAPWPGYLLVESLGKPANQFDVLSRRLSHVKLTIQAGLPTQVKGYVGFERLRGTAQRSEGARRA